MLLRVNYERVRAQLLAAFYSAVPNGAGGDFCAQSLAAYPSPGDDEAQARELRSDCG